MRMVGRMCLVLAGACGGGSGGGLFDSGTDVVVSDAPPTTLRRGTVAILEQSQLGMDFTVHTAEFSELADATIDVRETDGNCVIQKETFSAVTRVSAGTVTISGGNGPNVVLVADRENTYQPAIVEGLPYAISTLVTVTAAGATVPAFSEPFGFPDSIEVTDPPFVPGQPIVLNRSGFTATWNPTGGILRILITQRPTTTERTIIECVFGGSSRTGSIPATTLAALVTGLPQDATTVTIQTFNGVRPTVGEFEIALDGGFLGFTANATVQ